MRAAAELGRPRWDVPDNREIEPGRVQKKERKKMEKLCGEGGERKGGNGGDRRVV